MRRNSTAPDDSAPHRRCIVAQATAPTEASVIQRPRRIAIVINRCFVFFFCAAAFAQAPARIEVDPAQRFQYIDGFGVNFNGTYFREAQKPMIDMLIADLGATIFRLDPYGLTNWEAVNDNGDAHSM